MKYKAGQMVILVSAINDVALPFIGLVRTLSEISWFADDCWVLDPPIFAKDGLEIHWHEDDMKPVRDQPGADETLTWAGKPEKVAA